MPVQAGGLNTINELFGVDFPQGTSRPKKIAVDEDSSDDEAPDLVAGASTVAPEMAVAA